VVAVFFAADFFTVATIITALTAAATPPVWPLNTHSAFQFNRHPPGRATASPAKATAPQRPYSPFSLCLIFVAAEHIATTYSSVAGAKLWM
jgi:hypothetical protein